MCWYCSYTGDDPYILAEENFFRHRLTTLYPKIDEEGIKSAIGFLEQQKLVNCPCSVHTEERGYELIVFRRQPDRKMGSTDEESGDTSFAESLSDDDIFFSAEAEDAQLDQGAGCPESTSKNEGVLEQKTPSSEVPEGPKTKAEPQMSTQPCDSSLHSRESRGEAYTIVHQAGQKKKKKTKKEKKEKKESKTTGTVESPMIIDDEDLDDEREIPKKRKGFSYYPLLTYKRDLNKTFYYKYFKPYSYDYRRLRMEEDRKCPETEPHDTKCEWYDPDTIYILDAMNDISASEETAKQKIYDLYMSSLNSSHPHKEQCGCGTAAEIAYMGHHTGCNEFQYIHERESYEVLLVMLKKKKRVSFPGCPFNKTKRPRLHSPKYDAQTNDDQEEKPEKKNTPKPKMSQKTFDLLAEAAETAFNAKPQSPDPPTSPPESFSDQIAKIKDGFVCSHDTNGETHGEANGDRNDEPEVQAIDDMPPLVNETEV